MSNYELKAAKVSEFQDELKDALCVVVTDYRGITGEQMYELRKASRSQNVHIKILKNTLAKRALNGTPFSCLDEVMSGPVMLALSFEEPGSAAKLIKQYMKDVDVLSVKGLSLGDHLLGPDQLNVVATLPNKEQALSMLLGTLKAPTTKLAQTLQQTYSKLAYSLNALIDTKAN